MTSGLQRPWAASAQDRPRAFHDLLLGYRIAANETHDDLASSTVMRQLNTAAGIVAQVFTMSNG